MRNKFFATLLMGLLMQAALFSQEIIPAQTVDGDKVAYKVGDLIKLSLSPVKQEDRPKNLELITTNWVVRDVNGVVVKTYSFGNDSVFFGTGDLSNGQTRKLFFINVAVSYVYVNRTDKIITDVKNQVIQVSTNVVVSRDGSVPDNPVVPDEPVKPVEPQFEQGKYGLAKTTYDLAKKNMNDDIKKVAPDLANSFDGIASSIVAGALKTDKDIINAVFASNQNALNNAKVKKENVVKFAESLNTEVFNLYEKDKLSTAADFATAFREIANGLRGVK